MAIDTLRAESASRNSLPDFSTLDRAAIEAAIESLIGLLDAMDGDPDIEGDYSDFEHGFRSAPLSTVGAGERVGCISE